MFNILFVNPLSNFLDSLFALLGNYGLSIIVLTVIIRLILFFPNFKAYQSQIKMRKNTNTQEMREKIATLQEKLQHTKRTEEQLEIKMELAHITRDNIAGMKAGCISALIQLPVVLGLIYAIRGNEHILNETFLWFNLGAIDYWMIIIASAVTLLQLVINTKLNSSAQKPMQGQWMMYIVVPIMIYISASVMPSAIPLYWTVSALMATGQMFVFKLIENKKAPTMQF
ncbi:membrane protein insertase YidC [Solibacillus sp. CAU 1738]|uniref:YidC/Oxa1 family membrane protein insertase n=1 Tax=Solibacillus sp. CAU 1738 TaxID=3140363 RepID=UPI00325FF1E2